MEMEAQVTALEDEHARLLRQEVPLSLCWDALVVDNFILHSDLFT